MTFLAPLLLAAGLFGCKGGCRLEGYVPLQVSLVYGEAMAPAIADGGCVVYTDLSPLTRNPDAEGDKLAHIGKSVYECLTGQVGAVVSETPEAFYSEVLNFRIDGYCPGPKYYGCFGLSCRTVDTVLGHIGPQAICPAGAPMEQWSEACWRQFYAVLGHEVMHGWLGAFHS